MAIDYRALCQSLLPLAEQAPSNPHTEAVLGQARSALATPPGLTPLKWLPLPTLTRHALLRAGYTTVEAVQAASDRQLQTVRQIGPQGLRTIRTALAQWSQSAVA